MIKTLKNCFSNENVNLGRQKELDIAKGFSIIFMVLSHAFEILSWFFDPDTSWVVSETICDKVLGGSIGAPLFMFCMGISFCYSKRNTAKDFLKRAFNMLGIAYLLELTRTAIPGFLEWLIFRDPECIEYVYIFFCVDILQFATIALLCMALFKKLKLKPYVMIIIAVVFNIAGGFLRWVSTGSEIGDIAAGFIWHTYDESYFPLLNWLIFPVCGYAFGHLWLRICDKQTFFKIVTPIAWAIAVVYYATMPLLGGWYYFSDGDYYGMGIIDVVFAFIICFAMIGFGYYIEKWSKKLGTLLESMGRRINSIYCIHWTIYGFLYLALVCIVPDYLPQWTIIPTTVCVLVASDLLSRLYKKITSK